MRALIQLTIAVGVVGAALPSSSFAQAAASEEAEEITVRGQKTVTQYRLELEKARDEVFRLYNEANEGKDNDITCRDEQATGRRIRENVCRSQAENRASATAARDFLNSLMRSSGGHLGSGSVFGGGAGANPTGTQVAANAGTAAAQGNAVTGGAGALNDFEQEWERILRENRQLYRAVVRYAEAEDAYTRARGAEVAEPVVAVVVEEPPPAPAQAAQPRCEASVLTEYQQRASVARVSATISLANCPVATTGSFTVVARVKNDAGETTPLEFNETWERADAEDHKFNKDYPIGDNVELSSVRVRSLRCSCVDAAQQAAQ